MEGEFNSHSVHLCIIYSDRLGETKKNSLLMPSANVNYSGKMNMKTKILIQYHVLKVLSLKSCGAYK